MKKMVRVFAPATVANVACGFDILGFAVEQPGDEVVLRTTGGAGVTIRSITGDNGRLPVNPKENTAGVAVEAFCRHLQIETGIEMELHKKMPLGSGLGSSAASGAAAVFAANVLFDRPLSNEQLIPFVLQSEKAACGTAHADNAAPALLGGFALIRGYHPLDVVKIPTPEQLYCTIVHPQIEIRTQDARNILKKDLQLKDAITQWGNIAGLVAGLMKPDYELIRRSMQDVVIEPVRSLLIPAFNEVKSAALAAGALGCSISGSGPSIFALSRTHDIAQSAGLAMRKEFDSISIENEIYVSKINQEGPRILEEF